MGCGGMECGSSLLCAGGRVLERKRGWERCCMEKTSLLHVVRDEREEEVNKITLVKGILLEVKKKVDNEMI